MPYIVKEKRDIYDQVLNQLRIIETKGDLEYCIFKLLKIYMTNKTVNYSNLHDTVYAAIHAGHEYERRYLDVRENQAMGKNGDI